MNQSLIDFDCECGHKKSQHIYEEGSCRPGEICDCKKFKRQGKAVHHLKIQPQFFLSVKEGIKNFEIRKNDREFKAGDLVILEEFDETYTGKVLTFIIGYVTNFAQKKGYVVFSLLRELK